MKYIPTNITDVIVIEPTVLGDERGFFMETWQQRSFQESVADVTFVQDNHSKSGKGILRGLHYQIQNTQGKLVRVTKGEVFDVVVDLRQSSKSFGQWYGCTLSDTNKKMLWIPEGFAHGFLVMSKTAEFVYKCTDYYAPQYERSLLWNDPSLNIEWPLSDEQKPLLSEKDARGDLFANADYFD